MVSLSQQVAKLSARSPESPLTKTYSSAGTPRTYVIPAPDMPPPPPAKQTLKLSLQKKTAALSPQPVENPEPAAQTLYAAATTVGPGTDNSFTVVAKKKKPQKKGPLRPLYNPNDQKVVAQIHPDTPPESTVQATWRYLQMANAAIREYQKNPDYRFIRCYVTMKQNLVLQTSTKTQCLDYVPYLDAIKNRLEQEGKLHITAIDGEP